MKFDQSKLSANLKTLKNVIPARTTMPALEGVLIKGKEMIANNLELSMNIGIENADDESFIIPNNAIDFISKLPAGEVEIKDTGNQTLTIKARNIKNNFRTFDTQQFIIPSKVLKPKEHNVFSGTEFIEAAKKVIGTVPKVTVKEMLKNVYITSKNGCLEMVATDGFRIAVVNMKEELKEEESIDILIPLNTMQTLIKQDMAGKTTIHDQSTTATFYFYDKSLTSRLVSGQYPEHGRMLKMIEGTGYNMKIGSRIFKEALERLITVQRITTKKEPVIIQVADNVMTFRLHSEAAEHTESFDIEETAGVNYEAAYNPSYLEEAVKHVDSKEFFMRIQENHMSPILITDDEAGYKYCICPIARW